MKNFFKNLGSKLKSILSSNRIGRGLWRVITLPYRLLRAVVFAIRDFVLFFRDAVAELRNVSWLSRKDTLKFSAYILAFIVFGALTIAVLDFLFYRVFTLITT